MAQDPQTELPKGESLDVQWVAHVEDDDGHPTPAAGDSTNDDPHWIGVEDPNFGDKEEPNDADGEVKDR